MNVQIFGTQKCFDSKKAERFFKERKIKYQFIDIKKYPMSKGEFNSVKLAICRKDGIEVLIDEKCKSDVVTLIKYLLDETAKEEKIFENQVIIKTPIVRNGKNATLGYLPEIWTEWIAQN